MHVITSGPVRIPVGTAHLDGDLDVPEKAKGVVAFAHGSGSSRLSPRNRRVASVLRHAGLATLLFDLLTPREEQEDSRTAEFRFDIDLLARRLAAGTDWLAEQPEVEGLRIGYFGASTGAAAAIRAAARRPAQIHAVVSRGGRPDLAGEALAMLEAPILLIVGGNDVPVIGMNEEAARRIRSPKELEIVPGASHLFEEPGALDQVARLARDFFVRHLAGRGAERP
jgi:dienelactone hydrolase